MPRPDDERRSELRRLEMAPSQAAGDSGTGNLVLVTVLCVLAAGLAVGLVLWRRMRRFPGVGAGVDADEGQ